MAQPYVGEIRMFAGNFAPAGWMLCEGQLLPISENETLFNLYGTTYGGDGQNTFALPDLRGRIPIHGGTGPGLSTRPLAETLGSEEVTLTVNQLPSHTHPMFASTAPATGNSPLNAYIGESPSINLFSESAPGVALGVTAVSSGGGSQPHTNMMPYLCVNFIVSLFGIFPSPT